MSLHQFEIKSKRSLKLPSACFAVVGLNFLSKMWVSIFSGVSIENLSLWPIDFVNFSMATCVAAGSSPRTKWTWQFHSASFNSATLFQLKKSSLHGLGGRRRSSLFFNFPEFCFPCQFRASSWFWLLWRHCVAGFRTIFDSEVFLKIIFEIFSTNSRNFFEIYKKISWGLKFIFSQRGLEFVILVWVIVCCMSNGVVMDYLQINYSFHTNHCSNLYSIAESVEDMMANWQSKSI